LARFITAMRRIDPTGGPTPGEHNSFRGVALAEQDVPVRAAIVDLAGALDQRAAIATWDAALETAQWRRPAVWLHGDLHAGNLLVRDGRLSAVIDFGCLGVGDPACDVMAAWTCVPAGLRDEFRGELAVDDATWARGRGWALSFGLIALPHYRDTNPELAAIARHAIDEILTEDEVAP